MVKLLGTDPKYKSELINIKSLKNKNIDYLALGHYHKFEIEKLDNRGVYCYPRMFRRKRI